MEVILGIAEVANKGQIPEIFSNRKRTLGVEGKMKSIERATELTKSVFMGFLVTLTSADFT